MQFSHTCETFKHDALGLQLSFLLCLVELDNETRFQLSKNIIWHSNSCINFVLANNLIFLQTDFPIETFLSD